MTVLQFFGTARVALRGPDRLVASMAELWSPFAFSHADPTGAHPVLVEDVAVACAEVNRFAVASCPWPAVHAGVVARDGAAIAIPAESGAGKSTLVAALCLAGAGYVSDEALILDGTGAAHGYPKPLALAAASMAVLDLPATATAGEHGPPGAREHLVPARSLISRPSSAAEHAAMERPLPVRSIVLPQRHEDVTEVRLERAPRRHGLEALLRLGFNHYRAPSDFLVAAAAAVTGAEVWTLAYSDARLAATTMVGVLP